MSNNASVKKQRDVTSVVLRALVWIAGVLTLGVLAAITLIFSLMARSSRQAAKN